jgi:hypothetical protein
MDPEMLKAIASLVGAIAWPVVVLVIVLYHHSAIGRILNNLESFSLPGGIEGKIRHQVAEEARQLLRSNPDAAKQVSERQLEAAERVQQLAARADLEPIRRQMRELAREYESIRAAMPPSNERTGRMEVVATKLRTLGLAAEPLLSELASSSSPGDRLAAAMILQVRPKVEYLDWLVERFRTEPPFTQYHAAVALLSAARLLDGAERPMVTAAVRTAKNALGIELRGSDRWNVLETAERELA